MQFRNKSSVIDLLVNIIGRTIGKNLIIEQNRNFLFMVQCADMLLHIIIDSRYTQQQILNKFIDITVFISVTLEIRVILVDKYFYLHDFRTRPEFTTLSVHKCQ